MLGESQRMGQLIERLGVLLSSMVEGSEEWQRVQLRAALALTRLNLQQFSGLLPTLADAAALDSAAAVFPANRVA